MKAKVIFLREQESLNGNTSKSFLCDVAFQISMLSYFKFSLCKSIFYIDSHVLQLIEYTIHLLYNASEYVFEYKNCQQCHAILMNENSSAY